MSQSPNPIHVKSTDTTAIRYIFIFATLYAFDGSLNPQLGQASSLASYDETHHPLLWKSIVQPMHNYNIQTISNVGRPKLQGWQVKILWHGNEGKGKPEDALYRTLTFVYEWVCVLVISNRYQMTVPLPISNL